MKTKIEKSRKVIKKLTGNMKNNGVKSCGYLSRAGKSNVYDFF